MFILCNSYMVKLLTDYIEDDDAEESTGYLYATLFVIFGVFQTVPF